MSAAGSFSAVVVFKTSTPGNASGVFYQNTGLLGCEQPSVVADWALCLNGSLLGAGLGAGTSTCGADLSLYGGSVTDGNPHIGMVVRAGERLSLYVDGVRVATQAPLCTAARGNYSFQIGAMTAGSLFFNGDIAEIQLYDHALNSSEMLTVNQTLGAAYGVSGAAGQVVAWGNNANGQARVPGDLTNVWTVAGGGAFNLALRQDGTVVGWGASSQGQTNPPAGLTNVSALAAGSGFGLAIGNQPPQATNTIVDGFLDHELLITLPVANPDGNPLNHRLLSLPGAGALFQCSGGLRGVPIIATNTPVTDPAGRVVFAPAPGGLGQPYTSFGFLADDGLYSSGAGQVTINISSPPVPESVRGFWDPAAPGERFYLAFTGATNATYSVWAGTNLVDWAKIGVAAEPDAGRYEFIDASAAGYPQRFYYISAGL
jgi:hypothetical protein